MAMAEVLAPHTAKRPAMDIGVDVVTLLAEERLSRDRELESRLRLTLYGAGEDAGVEEALEGEEHDYR